MTATAEETVALLSAPGPEEGAGARRLRGRLFQDLGGRAFRRIGGFTFATCDRQPVIQSLLESLACLGTCVFDQRLVVGCRRLRRRIN